MTTPYTLATSATIRVIDFETTGSVKGYPVEPWQIGVVELINGQVNPEPILDSLLQIDERPFNNRAPGRHAQLRHELATAPTPAELWPHLADALSGYPLAAHNVGTERTVLNTIAPLHQLGPWIDTLALARYAYPDLETRALEHLIVQLGLASRLTILCPNRAPHDALYDAYASALLLEHLLALPGWQTTTIDALSTL